MKGAPINFRPDLNHRQRLEILALATERDITFFVEKCLEAHLPVLEKKHAYEIAELKKHTPHLFPEKVELNDKTGNAGILKEGVSYSGGKEQPRGRKASGRLQAEMDRRRKDSDKRQS